VKSKNADKEYLMTGQKMKLITESPTLSNILFYGILNVGATGGGEMSGHFILK
jgi:hypothetical protein